MNPKRTDRNDLIFKTNEGYMVKVVDYKDTMNVVVQFLDEYDYVTTVTWQNLSKGRVGNPFHRNKYGGYMGLLSNGEKPLTKINGEPCREYTIWKNMMKRCYSKTKQYPTYKNVSVCEEWKCYATFVETLPFVENYDLWLNDNNYCLDKDLKQNGVEFKVYSVETCIFIPNKVNVQDAMSRRFAKNVD